MIFSNFEMVRIVPSANNGHDYCATVDVETGGALSRQTTRRYIARRHRSYWYYTDTGKYVRPAHAIEALAKQWLDQHQNKTTKELLPSTE